MLPPETKWSESSMELLGVIPMVFQRCTVEIKLSPSPEESSAPPRPVQSPSEKSGGMLLASFVPATLQGKKKTLIYFTNKCIAVRKSVCKKNLLSLFLSQTTLDFVCCWSKQTEYPHLTADLSPKALLGPSNIVVATFSGFLIEVNKLQQLLVLKNIQEF